MEDFKTLHVALDFTVLVRQLSSAKFCNFLLLLYLFLDFLFIFSSTSFSAVPPSKQLADRRPYARDEPRFPTSFRCLRAGFARTWGEVLRSVFLWKLSFRVICDHFFSAPTPNYPVCGSSCEFSRRIASKSRIGRCAGCDVQSEAWCWILNWVSSRNNFRKYTTLNINYEILCRRLWKQNTHTAGV